MSREERNKLRGIFEKALREDGSKEMFDAVVKILCLFHRAQREEMLVVVGKFAWCPQCRTGWDITGKPNRIGAACRECSKVMTVIGGEGEWRVKVPGI